MTFSQNSLIIVFIISCSARARFICVPDCLMLAPVVFSQLLRQGWQPELLFGGLCLMDFWSGVDESKFRSEFDEVLTFQPLIMFCRYAGVW